MNEDEKWMKIAINEANLANNENEIPVSYTHLTLPTNREV